MIKTKYFSKDGREISKEEYDKEMQDNENN